MKNYAISTDKNEITAIRKVHQSKAISVSDLSKKLKSVSSNMNKKFVVEGHVIGLVDHKPENVIKILEGDKAHDFNHKIVQREGLKSHDSIHENII